MATRGKKKPAKRKVASASVSSTRGLSMFGWLASAAVAGAWAVSDGRPVRLATEALGHLQARPSRDAGDDRVAALIQRDAPLPPRSRPEPFRPAASRPERAVEALHPLPRSKPEVAATVPRVPVPAAAPLLPLAAPPLEYAMRPTRALPMPVVGAPAGEERHATRALAAHAAPDAGSPTLAEVESGASVVVLRSAGDWRYVRSGRSGTEGWVDGRFLAGEAMAADLATLAKEDFVRRR